MNEEKLQDASTALATRHLCTAEFEVGGGIIGIGASPFGDQRLGYISGGRFFGPRINGIILPGGGNWSRSGRLGDAASVGTFDAFLGHETQMNPPVPSIGINALSCCSRTARSAVKMCAQSIGAAGAASKSSASPASSISAATLFGISSRHTRMPSFSDSFFASGVPE